MAEQRPGNPLADLLPQLDLERVTMEELAEYLRQIESIELVAKGKAVAAMRETGASWREIARLTGKPHTTLRFWFTRYQESLADTQPEV